MFVKKCNTDWEKAQYWEKNWHDNCINSFHEEQKQLIYADKMGLVLSSTPKTPYNFNLDGKSILDIGGGAYSLLLKCVNFKDSYVCDPLMDRHPAWIRSRYREIGITALGVKGEDLDKLGSMGFEVDTFDEIWIYNVLEHVDNPEKIIQNALKLGRIIRIFEWLDTRLNDGHIHSLKEKELNDWLGGEGKVENISRGGAVGKCYYGIFKGKYYATSNSK